MFIAPSLTLLDSMPLYAQVTMLASNQTPHTTVGSGSIARVPVYSQFADISSPKWQKVGCGVTSLAMIIDYYRPNAVTVNALLAQGIKSGAYTAAGWSHQGLVTLSKKYGLTGQVYDLSSSSGAVALSSLSASVATGPVIASVHYKFQPNNPIPHLVVITGIKDGIVYYTDPAAKSGRGSISSATFLAAWKKRYIAIHPADSELALAA